MQKTRSANRSKVLVIGGGLGGIRTAPDLAEAERDVVLVDRARTIGGLMTQLDRTFPTNNCDLCTLAPNLSESGRRKHIELLTMTSVTGVAGEQGNFTVSLQTAPRHINQDKCTGCGDCYQKFPECVSFTIGLDHRAPTCMRYPQSTPQAFSIDLDKCSDIEALVKVCPAGAIIPDDLGRNREINCGAIVLSPGASLFDPSGLDYLAYATEPDVVTSLEYERILSASGPTTGQLVRPSNGRQPEKVAWIQCIGSRGLQKGAGSYCSSACCMFALKEAMVTKERFREDIETTIFFMDMRTFGKDYELYLQRARDEFGVRFIRSRPHSILKPDGSDRLSLNYTTEQSTVLHTEEFDLVVLSTGFTTDPETVALAQRLGIDLNRDRFPVTDPFNLTASSRPGIYLAGTFQSPKDIPETMVQASAAACMAARDLGPPPPTGTEASPPLPPERNVAGEEPRIGVFVCDCGENIGSVVDVAALVEHAGQLPGVVSARAAGHGCSLDSIKLIRQAIEEDRLNRVVIGGCSPRTHEAKFQELLQQAGLNKYLLEIANIRDQATWVHSHQADRATRKAKELISMAAAAVTTAQPLAEHSLPINKNILVVGGGVTGMTTSLELAEQGFKVYLAEKAPVLGGVALQLRETLEGGNIPALVADLIEKTKSHDRIEVITSALIVDHSGMPGMFKTGMQIGRQMFYRQLEHGITILATGAVPNRPQDYLLDDCERVLTQLELQDLVHREPARAASWENLVMIQCVGSRVPDNPNCSRICCQTAVKNALKILDLNPEARIFILYRDMRTYGFQEEYYQQARERGVIFVRYTTDDPPRVVSQDDTVAVSFTDPILGAEITVAADFLALSTGLVADADSAGELSMIFKLPLTHDNFLLEDHVKLRPVDLPVPGCFVAGTAHAPKLINESLVQARAVASRAMTMLARDSINLGAAVARVDGSRCAACLICVRACPFGVPFINADGYSEIDPAQCHGCGICVSECPAKAIQLMQFEDDGILAKLDELFARTIA